MKKSQQFAYVLLSYTPKGDTEIMAVGESAHALIEAMIELGFIEGDVLIDPEVHGDGKSYFQPLDEYLPNWKQQLPLLSRNEFNEWFAYNYRIDLYPLIQEKEERT